MLIRKFNALRNTATIPLCFTAKYVYNNIYQSSSLNTVLEKAKVNVKAVKVPIRRQKTMPVQIESNVIRVLPPKHLRKRYCFVILKIHYSVNLI